MVSWPTNICETVKATTNLMKYISQEFLLSLIVSRQLAYKTTELETVSQSLFIFKSSVYSFCTLIPLRNS
jgi:hypothetical protein